MLCLCSCSSWRWTCKGPKHVEDNVTYMFILKCALKLVLKSTGKRTDSIRSKIKSQNDCWRSEHEPGNRSFDTDWRIGDEKHLCPDGAQESHRATARCAVERSFWHRDAMRWCRSLFVTWSRTLRLIFISKSKIDIERTPFWVNRKHKEVCHSGLKLHHTKCVPGMLQWMAAPLEKVCAGTRDVLWRWSHFSRWINEIKPFWNQSHYFTVGPRMYVCMYVCMCVCVYVCMYVCVYVCMYVSTYACMKVFIHVFVRICIMYVYRSDYIIYIHT